MSRVKYGAFCAGLIISASAFAGSLGTDLTSPLPPASVKLVKLSEQPRGLVRAKDEAKIAAELVARIDKLPFRIGDVFKKGDTLVQFDCRRYDAELRAVSAELKGAEGTLKSNLELKRHKAIGSNEVEVSRSRVEEIRARVDALSVRSAQCKIIAPYDGRMVELFAHEHEMPTANSPLVKIVNSGVLEIDLIVPSRWLVWLKRGTKFEFSIDETTLTYPATITRIAAVVDPVSQTVAVRAGFGADISGVLPGMSGTAVFKGPTGI